MADVFDMIVAGDIPAYKVYEDDDVLAFLDLSQVTPGHTLVVPKTHVADIFEYDEALAARVLSKLPKIARAIKASDENIIGLNILSNNGVIWRTKYGRTQGLVYQLEAASHTLHDGHEADSISD